MGVLPNWVGDSKVYPATANIEFYFQEDLVKKLQYLFFMLVLLSIIGCASGPPAYQFRPGTYTGEGQGFGGRIEVRVEIS